MHKITSKNTEQQYMTLLHDSRFFYRGLKHGTSNKLLPSELMRLKCGITGVTNEQELEEAGTQNF